MPREPVDGLAHPNQRLLRVGAVAQPSAGHHRQFLVQAHAGPFDDLGQGHDIGALGVGESAGHREHLRAGTRLVPGSSQRARDHLPRQCRSSQPDKARLGVPL